MLIKIKSADLKLLMVCAFRYSLGRRTYMPELVTELIENYWKIFNENDWKQFIEDIEFNQNFNNLGDDCGIETWKNFEEFCKKRINKT